MKVTPLARFAVVALVFPATGCESPGKDNVLFVTRTNIGIDMDAAPAATDIGYSREEFVLSPLFEESQVLPVMTTIGTTGNPLDFTADQSFATGEAALILADAFDDIEEYEFRDPASVPEPVNSPFVAPPTTLSKADYWSGRIRTKHKEAAGRELYFFGTDTNLGLHVEWTGGTTPTSINLGYKRKELAFVPLIENAVFDPVIGADGQPEKNADGSVKMQESEFVEVRLPSLITTASSGAQVKGSSDTGISVHQSYATGSAATMLARQPALRLSALPALVSNFDEVAKNSPNIKKLQEMAEKEKSAFGSNQAANDAIIEYFDANKADPAKLAKMLKAAEDAGVGTGLDENNFQSMLALWATPDGAAAMEARLGELNALLDAMKAD